MRPATVALSILMTVTGAAAALALGGASNTPDPSSPPPSREAPTEQPTTKPTPEPTPTPEPEFDYPTADSVGACFDPIYHRIDGSLLAMRLWDCDEPHLSEFMGLKEIDASASIEWPGQGVVDDEADAICLDVFRDYVGIAYDRSSIYMTTYTPTHEGWLAGDHEVYCIADTTSASPFTSSVRNLRE